MSEERTEIYTRRLFQDNADNMLWNLASALKHMVASNHEFGDEAWQAFRRELNVIVECANDRRR